MSFFRALKRRMATVRPTSWHYKLVSFIWEKKQPKKACAYYWWYLPSSVVAAAVVGTAVVVMSIVSTFVGYLPKGDTEKGETPFQPYKTLPSGKRVPVAPWEIAALGGAGFLGWWLIVVAPGIGFWVGIGLGVFVLVGLAVLLLLRNWETPRIRDLRRGTRAWWDKACPPLDVKHEATNGFRSVSGGSGGSGRA